MQTTPGKKWNVPGEDPTTARHLKLVSEGLQQWQRQAFDQTRYVDFISFWTP